MKKTRLFHRLALAACCAIAARFASAQPPAAEAPVDAAKKQFGETEQRLVDYLAENPSGERQSRRDKLRPFVEQTFAARQRLQQAELDALRRRLSEIEQAISDREKNRQVIIEARIEELLSGAPAAVKFTYREEQRVVNGAVETVRVPIVVPAGSLPVSATFEANSPALAPLSGLARQRGLPPKRQHDVTSDDDQRGAASGADDFDLDTRERLLQLDLQAAEAESRSAETELARARGLYQTGTLTAEALRAREKDQRLADINLQRVQAKLKGFALLRVDMEAAAEVGLAEAKAARQKAASRLRSDEANRAAAMAEVRRTTANVKAAEARRSNHEEVSRRLKRLAADRAVDENAMITHEKDLKAIERALSVSQHALACENADLEKSDSQIAESQAALTIAELRVAAAQARLDRLKKSKPSEPPAEKTPSGAASTPGR